MSLLHFLNKQLNCTQKSLAGVGELCRRKMAYYILTDDNYNVLCKDGTLQPWSGPIMIGLPDNVRKFTEMPKGLPQGSRVFLVETEVSGTEQSPAS